MPRLAVARKDQIDAVCRESHSLWSGGLSFEDYRDFWDELSRTAWGRKYLTYYVWLGERDEVLSSFKLYRPRIQMLGRTARACVIGAVFTPRARRGRRYALEMMRAGLGQARDRGEDPALLFSDIGTRFYEMLGFRPLPAEEVWGRLPRVAPDPPANWELQGMQPRDLETVQRLHEAWCRSRPVAILRDLEHWEFLLTRARSFFSRLGNPGLAPVFRFARYRGEAVGYLITVEGHREWSIREVGARGGDPRMMAAVLRAGAVEACRAGLRSVYAWLPREITAHLPEWKLRRGPRRRAIPMVLPLNGSTDLSPLGSPDAAFFPYQDQF